MTQASLSQKLKRAATELAVFIDLGKTLTSSLDIKEVLRVMMSKVSELLRPKTWSLLLLDEGTGELAYEVVVGYPRGHASKRIPLGEGIEGWVAREGRPLLVNGTKELARLAITPRARVRDPFSVLCVPLRSKGKTLGVIEVTDRTGKRAFRPEDLTILGTLADYAAIAIENAKNFQRVQELTITDDITGLYNSRHLHHMLDFEIVRSKRYQLEFSLIFLDLDYFKRVNDQYGHLIGSKLLREFGQFVARGLRQLDVGTRYGGDEFVILLPQTPKKEGYKAALRIRERLSGTYFLQSEGLNIKVAASFGVSAYPTDAFSKDDIIRLADQAMYRVKAATRDDVAMA
jgi:diguanylate cyclase (GGDEF)-like protein